MPRLNNTTAKAVHNAESTGSVLLDEDQYRLKLEKVIISPKPDKNGNSYWVWTFQVVSGQTTGDKFKGKTIRTNTGFSENQLWFVKMLFEAFEARPNVDTDTLLGKEILAIVGQGEVTAGPRKGQMRSEIQTAMSVNSDTSDDWDDNDPSDSSSAKVDDPGDDGEPDF